MSVVMFSHSLLYLFKCHVWFFFFGSQFHSSIHCYCKYTTNVHRLTAGLLAINIFAPCIFARVLVEYTLQMTKSSVTKDLDL